MKWNLQHKGVCKYDVPSVFNQDSQIAICTLPLISTHPPTPPPPVQVNSFVIGTPLN